MSANTKDLRNVVLLGHSDSGKTTLIETMLYEGGAIKRRGSVEGQNTVSDNTDLEHEKGKTIFSHQMFVNWRNNKINIIDTPGFDDFIGEFWIVFSDIGFNSGGIKNSHHRFISINFLADRFSHINKTMKERL